MKHNTSTALAALGLAAVPVPRAGTAAGADRHRAELQRHVRASPHPGTDEAFNYIQAIGAGGNGAYNAGLFGFDSSQQSVRHPQQYGRQCRPG